MYLVELWHWPDNTDYKNSRSGRLFLFINLVELWGIEPQYSG